MPRLTQGQAGWNAGLDQAIYYADMLKHSEGPNGPPSEETIMFLDNLIQSCKNDKAQITDG